MYSHTPTKTLLQTISAPIIERGRKIEPQTLKWEEFTASPDKEEFLLPLLFLSGERKVTEEEKRKGFFIWCFLCCTLRQHQQSGKDTSQVHILCFAQQGGAKKIVCGPSQWSNCKTLLVLLFKYASL